MGKLCSETAYESGEDFLRKCLVTFFLSHFFLSFHRC